MSELRTHEDVERDVLKRVRIQVKAARNNVSDNIPCTLDEKCFWTLREGLKLYEAEILRRLKEMEEGK